MTERALLKALVHQTHLATADASQVTLEKPATDAMLATMDIQLVAVSFSFINNVLAVYYNPVNSIPIISIFR